jgi:glutathione S-transferase
MIELIQSPWSPYCIVQRRILEYSGTRFKIHNLPKTGDRALIWKLTRERYYAVPIIKDGKNVIFELDENSQVIAKYINEKYDLGLFPQHWRGVQAILWRYIEDELEGAGFKLNDVYYRDFVAKDDQVAFIRHKERKFGRGCLEQWREQRGSLLKQLEQLLRPFEDMVTHRPFLLDERPRFVDFDLYGILGNFLHSGRYTLPAAHGNLRRWHRRMTDVTHRDFNL